MSHYDGSYKIFVKDGDYGYDDKSGDYGVMDFTAEYDTFAEGLREFLDWSSSSDTKVVLTFKPKKAKAKTKTKKS